MTRVTMANADSLRALICNLADAGIPFFADAGALQVQTVGNEWELTSRAAACEADARIRFAYDTEEAKGTLSVQPGGYGPYLYIDDAAEALLAVDMFKAAQEGEDRGPVAILFYPPKADDAVMSVIAENGGLTVVMTKEMVHVGHDHDWGFHSDGTDRVYRKDPEPEDDAAETVA